MLSELLSFVTILQRQKKLPKVGSGFRPSIERIAMLKPTLVFGSVEGAEKNLKKNIWIA